MSFPGISGSALGPIYKQESAASSVAGILPQEIARLEAMNNRLAMIVGHLREIADRLGGANPESGDAGAPIQHPIDLLPALSFLLTQNEQSMEEAERHLARLRHIVG